MIVGIQNGHEKIKIDEEAISEILVADTDSETDTEARGGGEQASADDIAQLQQVAEDYQTGDCLKEGKKIFT